MAILSTDMVVHAKLLSNLDNLEPETFSALSQGGQCQSSIVDLYIETVLHTADLSTNPLGLDQAVEWGRRCLTEFSRQARMEEANNIPVTPFMVGLEQEKLMAKTQYGFCFYVVKPWFQALEKFPIFQMEEPLENLQVTIKYYEDLMTKPSPVATIETIVE